MWRSLYSLMRRESAVQAAPGGAREGDASRAASTRPPSSRSPSQAAPTPSTDSTPASLLTSSTGTGSSQSIASLSMAAAAAVASPAAWAGVRRESWQPKSEPEEWARRGRQKRERSLLLLLLLAYQGREEQRVWNPYRALLETLQDERYQYGEGEEEERPEGGREGGRGGGAPALLRLPFDRLFTAFGRLLPLGEPAPLLFYTLLSSPNPLFLSTSLAQGDVESLLLPLLHQLYRPDRLPSLPPSPRPLYLLLTILLLFSQDSAFNTALFRRHFLPSVPWYKERLLGRTSLGSLALLCLLRALLFALHPAPAPSLKPIPETPSTSPTTSSSSQESTSSLYLLQTSGAILLNLAAQAEHLHDYAALRLTQVLLLLLRRYVRLVEGLLSSSCPPLPLPAAGAVTAAAPSSFPPSSSTSLPSHHPPGHSAALSSYSPPSAASSDPNPSLTHALLSSGLRTLLSFFSIALSPSLLPSNLALVHSLLYSRQHLEPLLAHPAVRALATASFPPSLPPFPSPSHPVQEGGGGGGLGLVPGVLEFFGRLFDETEGTLSVEQAMQVLEKGAREWVGGREGGRAGGLGAGMAADPELKFTYEEETEADSFFVPYIWETIYTITKEDLWWMPQYIQLFGPTPSPSLPPSAPPPRPPPSDAAPSSQGMVRRLLAGTMSVIPTSLISLPPPSRAQNQLSRNGRTSTVDAGAEEDAGRPSITALPVVVTMNV
ncbi:Dymeclin [Nannochloropsis gaditana]|uniref:Dymeclin n=1 Tax=Nannochloropsis gaditana TaxID=72520 RepID=W7TSF2_9STRA|nr:Dymeclin [Nannochloropsis gaditana]